MKNKEKLLNILLFLAVLSVNIFLYTQFAVIEHESPVYSSVYSSVYPSFYSTGYYYSIYSRFGPYARPMKSWIIFISFFSGYILYKYFGKILWGTNFKSKAFLVLGIFLIFSLYNCHREYIRYEQFKEDSTTFKQFIISSDRSIENFVRPPQMKDTGLAWDLAVVSILLIMAGMSNWRIDKF